MINYNKICVFDFETDGSDPRACSPVQIAAVIIDPIKLEIIPNSEFNINFKPEVLEQNNEYIYTTDILEFHSIKDINLAERVVKDLVSKKTLAVVCRRRLNC